MKNVSTKIAYMVIGSLLTIIGYHFGNIDNNTADAQEKADTPIVDEIQCRRLVIVGEDDTPHIVLDTRPDRNGGSIEISDQDERLRLLLDSEGINLWTKTELVASIGSDGYGGHMAIWNKGFVNNPRPIVRIGTTAEGGGFVITKDFHEQDTDVMHEPNKVFKYKSVGRLRSEKSIMNIDFRVGKTPTPTTVSELLKGGAKLPPFNFNDVVKRSEKGVQLVYAKNSRIRNRSYNGQIIWFTEKDAWIELSNGTRYTANTENCIIDMETHTISEGELLKNERR